MTWSYERTSSRRVQVRKDGVFAGELERWQHRPTTGLHRPLSVWWAGIIDGRDVRALTLTAAKAVIEKEQA